MGVGDGKSTTLFPDKEPQVMGKAYINCCGCIVDQLEQVAAELEN